MDYNDPDVLTMLAADDPGGSVETAAETLSAMTQTVTKVFKVDEKSMYDRLGPAAAEEILVAIETSNVVSARAKRWITPESGGIDVGSPVARGLLDQMVAAGELTAAQADSVKTLADEQATKYPGLRAVHVKRAREAT